MLKLHGGVANLSNLLYPEKDVQYASKLIVGCGNVKACVADDNFLSFPIYRSNQNIIGTCLVAHIPHDLGGCHHCYTIDKNKEMKPDIVGDFF